MYYKRTLGLFFLLITYGFLSAQKDKPKDCDCNNISGVWESVFSNGDTLTVRFACIDTIIKSKIKDEVIFRHVIWGWHRYTQTDIEVENTLNDSLNIHKFSIFGSFLNGNEMEC